MTDRRSADRRRKAIERHLSRVELDDAIDAAQRAGEARLVRRLVSVKCLYLGDTLSEAAGRVGVDVSAISRWSDDWNERGVEGLRPSFGGGRPPKLSASQRERLAAALETHRPWEIEEVTRLIETAFDVSYSERHVFRLLERLEVTHVLSGRSDAAGSDASDRPDAVERAAAELADCETDSRT